MGRACTACTHLAIGVLCAYDLRFADARAVLNTWTVTLFVVAAFVLAVCNNDAAAADKRQHGAHTLLEEGICGCVPSRGKLLRVRLGFFLHMATLLLPLVVATRLLPWPHFAATLLLFGCTVVVCCHVEQRRQLALYGAGCAVPALLWTGVALERVLRL